MSGTIGDWERARELVAAHDRSFEEIQALEAALESPTGVEPDTADVPAVRDDVLMERGHSGLRVELVWSSLLGVGVRVTEGDSRPVTVAVRPHEALDAFHHPYCYLP